MGKKKIMVSLPEEIIEKIEKIADKMSIPKSSLIEMAIRKWLEEVEKSGKIELRIT